MTTAVTATLIAHDAHEANRLRSELLIAAAEDEGITVRTGSGRHDVATVIVHDAAGDAAKGTARALLDEYDAWREDRADLSANDGPGTDPDDWAASDDSGCDLAARLADVVRTLLGAES